MKTIVLLCALFAFITFSKVVNDRCQKHTYNYQNFVLTWPGTFCLTKKCQTPFYKNWNKKTFSIHGLWPSSTQKGYLACVTGVDPYCNTPFNFQNLESNLAAKLQKVMVAYKKNEKASNFWKYEWSKHGVCYLNLTKKAGSKLSHAQIANKYFGTMLSAYNQLTSKFKITKQLYKSKNELANALNLKVNQVLFICDKKNNLSQLRICYSLVNNNPGNQKLINCPKNQYSTFNECKTDKIRLPTKIDTN